MKKNTVYLTGYEQENIQGFIKRIKKIGITTLADVRQYPLSRKKGFSKNVLARHLEDAGIKYVHLKELGTPKVLREKLKEDGNYVSFFRGYRAYIKNKHLEIQKLADLSQYETVCIMCFERDCELCHRTIVADEMMKQDTMLRVLAI